MANNKADDVPVEQAPVIHGSTLGSAAPHITFEKSETPNMLETVPTNMDDEKKEVPREELVASLGIPDWQVLEKKIVRRLDMTLLPQLWILYMFVSNIACFIWDQCTHHLSQNFLNRTNIA